MSNGIRSVEIKKDEKGAFNHVRIIFGPHYFIELQSGPGNRVDFTLGATHHGFKADASEIGGELEKLIEHIRKAHPKNLVD